jgi:hypothetical protein
MQGEHKENMQNLKEELRAKIENYKHELAQAENQLRQLCENQKSSKTGGDMGGETEDDMPASPHPPPPNKRSRFAIISQQIVLQFQPSVDPDDIPYEQIAFWKNIFSYIQPNDYERLHLRRLCNMFKASLKAPPPGKWTEYPHPNHASIDSLFNRLNALNFLVPHLTATVVFIKEGEHDIQGYEREPAAAAAAEEAFEDALHEPYLRVKYAMKIIGAGRDKTFIQGGGFQIQGAKEEGKKVVLKGMTTSNGGGSGLLNNNGLSFLCDSMTFTQCGCTGVFARNTNGRLINCVITQCRYSGLYCHSTTLIESLVELEGSQTKVEGNGTADNSGHYGLYSFEYSSIHLLYPLTKESVSTHNHGGRNYCSLGTGISGVIQTVDSFELL